jgi:hypothetical protein
MARCGCGGGSCNCFVEAGTGTTVTGSGSSTNPFVVSADAPPCSAVRPCISAGNGAAYNAASGVVSARPSTDPGNLVEFGGDGGLLVETDCTTVRACLSEGNGIDYDPVTGQISARPSTDPGNTVTFGGDGGLYAAGGAVDCATVRPCISAGEGVAYDPVTGVIAARPSADAGNAVTFGGDGGLFAPTAATVATACGLTGDGSVGAPLAAAVGAWPYPCDIDTSAGVVVCDGAGNLRSEPRGQVSFTSFTEERTYANLAVPAGFDQPGDSFATNIVNPDPCRSALVYVEREADVDFILPAGAGAAYGHATDEVFFTRNTGTTTITDLHTQTTKVFALAAPLGPGAALPVTFDVTLGRGSGGATYNRIQVSIRVLLISL